MSHHRFTHLALAAAFFTVGCNLLFSKTGCDDTLTCGDASGGSAQAGNSGDGDSGGTGDGDGDQSETGGEGGSGAGTGGTEPNPCEDCSGDTPECNDNDECVQCTEDDHCDGATPACVDESCEECGSNDHCTEAEASVCEDSSCVPCSENADCAHIAGRNVCNVDQDMCVECTSSADCGGNPCNPLTYTCSEFGTNRLPCQSCDTDENCETAAHYCVPLNFQGADRGGYCLKTAPDCDEPFLSLIAGRDSLSGENGQNYCGINEALATCEAVRALIDNVTCPGGEDSECPESGRCEDIGGVASNRCTYTCSGATQCPADPPGNTCGPGMNDFCGYVP